MAIVSKVPAEVLTEIFHLLCKKSISVCELDNSSYKEDFPWAVGLVCRQWRTAFLSYPPIWASLTFSDSYHNSSRIANLGTHIESYAREINRRLALYLERSRGYPLRLDISLWSDDNKPFTTMALEMFSACSQRWQTVTFRLFRDWQPDSILPCKGKLPALERLDISSCLLRRHAWDIFEVAPRLTYACANPWSKDYGWILPWTQLTELDLTLTGGSVIASPDVPNLLPMLHNIKELRFRFSDNDMDFEGGFLQFAPTPLHQLRVLEVPHPDILSWFEVPLLRDLYFADYQQDDDVPLRVHKQISSLIQRSGCTIRKLSFESGRRFYVGTLKDVEELVIDYTYSDGIRSPIDVSSLPGLRLVTMICRIDEDFKASMTSLTTALNSTIVSTRGGTPVSLLERVMVELQYDSGEEQPKIPKILPIIADKWPVVVFRTRCS